MKWITRERPKIDRIACPWLVVRFIDQEPEFLYVPSSEVLSVAGDRSDSVRRSRRRADTRRRAVQLRRECRPIDADQPAAELECSISWIDSDRLEMPNETSCSLPLTKNVGVARTPLSLPLCWCSRIRCR